MIDPTKITNYNLTISELEETLLFWVFAAGHNAISTARGVDKFLKRMYKAPDASYSPFASIVSANQRWGWRVVVDALATSGLGCWQIKSKTIHQLIYSDLDLRTCTVDELDAIYGIGPKTARCFVLHSRENVRVAGLDTHVLACLNDLGLTVPKSPGKKYNKIEGKFLEFADAAKRSVADLDLMIWNAYSSGKNKDETLSFLRSIKMPKTWYDAP
jgi:hypothetical protein